MEIDILWLVVSGVCAFIVIAAAYSARKSYLLKKKEMERAIASYRLMEERADAERRKAQEQRITLSRSPSPAYKTPEVKTATVTKPVRTSSYSSYSRRPADDSDDVAAMIMMNNMVAATDTPPSYSYSSSSSSDDSCSRSSYESSSSSSYSSYSSSDSSSSYSSSDSGSSSSCD